MGADLGASDHAEVQSELVIYHAADDVTRNFLRDCEKIAVGRCCGDTREAKIVVKVVHADDPVGREGIVNAAARRREFPKSMP